MGIATIAEQAVDLLLNNFITTKSAAMTAVLAPIALTCVTVYVLLMGFAIMRGEANDTLHTFVWKSFKVAFVCGIALSAGEYQALAIEGITGLQGAITGVFGANTVGGVIDNASQPYESLGQALWSQGVTGFIPNFSLIAAAGMTAMAQFFVTLIALGMYLMAKVALALVLAVGPIFILCAAFPATQKYTESWIAQGVMFAMLNALLAAAITMLFDISSSFASQVSAGVGTINVVQDTLALLCISAALCVVVLNVQSLASALSGGLGLQGIGREVGRAMSQMMQKREAEPERGGGSIESSGAVSRRPAAGAAANEPLYQRHVIDNIRRSPT